MGSISSYIVDQKSALPIKFVTSTSASDGTYDNVTITPLITDHSVRQNHLTPVGTHTKVSVNTNAALVGHTGLRGADGNYLMDDYRDDLDFGTGDFSAVFWAFDAAWPASAEPVPFYRGSNWYGTGENMFCQISVGNPKITLGRSASQYSITSSKALSNNQWQRVTILRRSGVVKIYIDDEETASAPTSRDLDNANAKLYVQGWDNAGSINSGDASNILALMRFSKTAPSADQIAFAYEQEKHLFKPGALAVLGGTGAITGIAHDERSRLSYVAQADGYTTMQEGFIPVAFTATDCTNGIEVQDGVVIPMGASDTRVQELEPKNLREEIGPDHSTPPKRIEIEHEFDGTETTVEMPKGYKPLRVWVDGSLEREGSGNDYEIEWTGFRYQLTWAAAPAGTSYAQIELEQMT